MKVVVARLKIILRIVYTIVFAMIRALMQMKYF